MQFHGGQFINGQWVRSGGAVFQSFNPRTGATLPATFAMASAEDIHSALAAAQQAAPLLRRLPPAQIADFLVAVADELMALGDLWLETAEAETALPKSPRLEGERARTCGQLKIFSDLLREGSWVQARIDTALPDRKPLPRPDLRMMLRPLGPVVVFDASNFPLAFGACGNDMASAIAAGCPVIIKGHTLHPATNELAATAVAKAISRCNLPPGTFALLQGSGREVGSALVRHPSTAAVGFTGSESGGRALMDLAAARPHPIPVYAEMGSLNPLLVLPGALEDRLETLADGLAQSLMLGAGQFCTKPGLILLVDSPKASDFVKSLTSKLAAAPAFTLLDGSMQKTLASLVAQFASTESVTPLVKGAASDTAGMGASLFEINSTDWLKHPALRCEAFGPMGVVVRVADGPDLLHTLEAIEGTLTATVHHGASDAPHLLAQIADSLEERSGRIIWNGFPTGVEVSHAMMHGGPYPATANSLFSSVGTQAILRFARPVSWQNAPQSLLPLQLRNENPAGVLRLVNGQYSKDRI